MAIELTTPVGRIVQGELWKPQPVTDNKGQPKLGADGKPQVDYFLALAIPKEPGHTHWAQTSWGRQIWEEGHRAHPNFAPHPTFSWKIEDGDSQVPNKKGRKNCDREGFPGNWILKLRSGFPIPTYNANGTAPMPAEAFKTGHYAQALINVKGNTGDTPGVYLNPMMVALSGYGIEIVNTPDASQAGFGAAPLPQGASPVPLGAPDGFAPPAAPSMPAPAPHPAPPAVPGSVAAPRPPMPVPPNPAFTAGPGAAPAAYPSPPAPGAMPAPAAPSFPTSPSSVPPAPMAPPAPPAAPAAPAVPQMTAAAQGRTYEQYRQAGWSDEQMRAAGVML